MIVFDDVIIDVLSHKNVNPIITELFIRDRRKLNISLAFISQSYFVVTKDMKLNYTHYFIMKIPNKWEVEQIYHSSDIEDFMNLNINVLKRHLFIVIDATLVPDNHLRFINILF